MNPISKVAIIPQGVDVRYIYLKLRLDIRRGRDNNVTRKMHCHNQVDEMTVLLSQQLNMQRQNEEIRTEVLNPLFQVKHNHHLQVVVGDIESDCQANHIRAGTKTTSTVVILQSSSKKYNW